MTSNQGSITCRDKVIEQMINLPSNRTCADCSVESPVIVNLTFRTFVCEECVSAHIALFKEYNKLQFLSSIKFAPTSTFTEEEISRMRSFRSGNKAINKTFLAAYDAKNRNHPRHITSESDIRERKSFLKQKYVKRTWYRDQYGNSLELSNSNRARNNQRIMEERQDKIIRQYDPHYRRPHETILKVMTLPQNKRCADCSTKQPMFVDLTHRSFVCEACAKVHTKLGHKIAEVGRYNFTAVDIVRMQHESAGNENLNSKFLACYNPVREQIVPPSRNSSDHIRMSWIIKKYEMRVWYHSLEKIDALDASEYPGEGTSIVDPRKSLGRAQSQRIILNEDPQQSIARLWNLKKQEKSTRSQGSDGEYSDLTCSLKDSLSEQQTLSAKSFRDRENSKGSALSAKGFKGNTINNRRGFSRSKSTRSHLRNRDKNWVGRTISTSQTMSRRNLHEEYATSKTNKICLPRSLNKSKSKKMPFQSHENDSYESQSSLARSNHSEEDEDISTWDDLKQGNYNLSSMPTAKTNLISVIESQPVLHKRKGKLHLLPKQPSVRFLPKMSRSRHPHIKNAMSA